MMQKISQVHAASAFMIFFLTSCKPIISPDPAVNSPASYIDEARTPALKCGAIAEWIKTFETQYPSFDLVSMQPSVYENTPQLGALFNRDIFKPLFGFEYIAANADKLREVRNGVVSACEDPGNVESQEAEFFRTRRRFFNQTFDQFNPHIERHALRNYHYPLIAREAMDQMQTLPLDRTGLNKLDREIVQPVQLILPLLPQRQQKAFLKELADKRAEIVSRVGEGTPVPAPLPDGSIRSSPSIPPPLEDRLAARLKDLESIPLTLEGRSLSVNWLAEFEREFAGDANNVAVARAKWAWMQKREKIFEATKSDFMARLARLPRGQGSEAQHSRLLEETFPLASDPSMTIYKQYRAAMLARQEPFFRKAFDRALSAMRSVRDAISEAARTTVRGAGKIAPQ